MPTVQKQKSRKPKELKPSTRLDKIIANRTEQGMVYVYDTQDKREIVFEDLKKRYPDTLKLSYQWVMRLKEPSTRKEWIVYHCNQMVTDRDNVDHTYDSMWGVWTAIEASGKTNPETGEREDARIKRSYNVFDIPFEPETMRRIIHDERLILQPSQFIVGIANEDPSELVAGRKWLVHNENEFIDEDFDVLYYAAANGFLTAEEGGAEHARKEMDSRRQQPQQPQPQETPSKKR